MQPPKAKEQTNYLRYPRPQTRPDWADCPARESVAMALPQPRRQAQQQLDSFNLIEPILRHLS
jgi:hypothetical protein